MLRNLPRLGRTPRRFPTPVAGRSLLAAVAGLALTGATQAAHAATVDYAGGTLQIVGTPGADDLLLSHGGDWSEDPGAVEIKSWSGGELAPGAAAACVPGDEDDLWVCPRPARIVVTLHDGDDAFTVYEPGDVPFGVPIELDGGAGDDRLWAAGGDDTLDGGEGDDVLNGERGHDVLDGGAGDDRLAGRAGDDRLDGGAGDDTFEDAQAAPVGASDLDAGADTYIGGPGDDRFSYFGRPAGVTVRLDGVANDGEPGERDDVRADVEHVGGGAGDDVLVGSAGADHLWGSDGDDRISGGAGNDRLDGDDGNDRVDGGRGHDRLDGGCMTDVLIGGPGRDSFNSDGSCASRGLRSRMDRIEAADGARDRLIFCQVSADPGGDRAIVDRTDPVARRGPGACATVVVRRG